MHEHVANERRVSSLENVGVQLERPFNIDTCNAFQAF